MKKTDVAATGCLAAVLGAVIAAAASGQVEPKRNAASAEGASAPAATEKPQTHWYRSPTLAIMTGFIKEPLKPYSIQEWEKGLGSKMDADRWVRDFKEAGATYLIFYDKWIDGFVFHDTRTTKFKTGRDFVRQVVDACHRGNLRLVFYFNAVSDGNPEFDQWALLDRQGKPIVFSPGWPTRYQTLHSPFRKVAVEQARELLSNYGRIDGIWLDIFGERLDTTSPWVTKGYQAMYGVPFDKASPASLAEFNARTLASYLDEVQPIARKQQPDFVWTANGAGSHMLPPGLWSKWVGVRLQYGSDEGHSFHRMDELARMAWVLPKPIETGLLLCSSWFTPMEDKAPPASMTSGQAIAAAAVAVCQGASVYMALTPDHSGNFGEDLQRAKAVGAWFKTVEPLLLDARPYADVGIVLGSPPADGPGLPGGNTFWKRYEAKLLGAWQEAIAMSDSLARAGAFGQLLYAPPQGASWPASLAGYRAILVPERAVLDDARIEQLREYVRQGGRLIAFGHASMLDACGARHKEYALADVLGVRCQGEVAFPAKALRTLVKVDSEYSPEFAAENLVDELPTAWASAGTPMPHWAEILLAEPVEVAKVELVSRHGPYLVTDIDVEAHDGSAWKPVKSVRGATGRAIAAVLEPSVRSSRVRVKILREIYEGQDRQYADVEAIRVLDKAGRDWAVNKAARFPVIPSAPEVKEAFAQRAVTFPPMAVRVQPTTAHVVAALDEPQHSAAILCNRFGRGEAILITTSEASFQDSPAFWVGLRQLAVGKPTIACQGEHAGGYRIILTRVGQRHVLHVIDPAGGSPGHKAADVTVSLEAERVGSPRAATRAEDKRPLEFRRHNGQVTFTVRPDPVASVVLE